MSKAIIDIARYDELIEIEKVSKLPKAHTVYIKPGNMLKSPTTVSTDDIAVKMLATELKELHDLCSKRENQIAQLKNRDWLDVLIHQPTPQSLFAFISGVIVLMFIGWMLISNTDFMFKP